MSESSLSLVAAGSAITVKVFKNGVDIALPMSIGIGSTYTVSTFDRGTYTFDPEDTLDVRISTPIGWLQPTAGIMSLMEIEE